MRPRALRNCCLRGEFSLDMIFGSAALLLYLASVSISFGEDKSLAADFAAPPSYAAPQTWWHWMNGNKNGELIIPSQGGNAEFSDGVLKGTSSGKFEIEAWRDGTYEVKLSDGTTRGAQVSGLPPRIFIGGPWRIDFPPDRGAPSRATFASLDSWNNRSESGIKYFSGTAVYTTKFSLDPSRLIKIGDGTSTWGTSRS